MQIALQNAGFEVDVVERGETVLAMDLDAIDLVLLDVMLPGLQGFEVCRRIRERAVVPVIMLTARGLDDDRVGGLRVGADDYVTKPFSMNELVERVRAQLRRRYRYDRAQPTVLRVGDLTLDLVARTVRVEERVEAVTETELRLLALLALRPGRVRGRSELTRHLWREGSINEERTVDTHVKNLRRKLESDPSHPRRLLSVRGVGYLLRAVEDD